MTTYEKGKLYDNPYLLNIPRTSYRLPSASPVLPLPKPFP